ncbi:hypothetical protein [Micromonospora viridifaciens]|uniref:hypothetical protein n=1 Tax=Micromonospora viridifaciens TaxID=1881 RepID=UPI000B5AE64C|nr:hypothetical protein [Micromonospora viridifaciens]
MDVPELLCQAASSVPASATSGTGLTVADANEYLGHSEWDVALDILMELGDVYPAETSFWDLCAQAAHWMQIDRAERWCHWRRFEVLHGVIRADLQLVEATAPGCRHMPLRGDGRLRPLWDIGDVTAVGNPDLHVARIWVEYEPDLNPGERGAVRLAPLSPERWRRLTAGDVITMHEQMPVAGTATITEATFPQRPRATP